MFDLFVLWTQIPDTQSFPLLNQFSWTGFAAMPGQTPRVPLWEFITWLRKEVPAVWLQSTSSLVVLAGQSHTISSRVRDKAVLGTKLISRFCKRFRWFLFAFLFGSFDVKIPVLQTGVWLIFLITELQQPRILTHNQCTHHFQNVTLLWDKGVCFTWP